MRVKCLAQEHNAKFLARSPTQTARSGDDADSMIRASRREEGANNCLFLAPPLRPGFVLFLFFQISFDLDELKTK